MSALGAERCDLVQYSRCVPTPECSWPGFYALASDRQILPSLLALLMAPQAPLQLQLSVLGLVLELITPPAAAVAEGLPSLSGGAPLVPPQVRRTSHSQIRFYTYFFNPLT